MSANTFRKDEPPEHMRFAAYLQALEQVADPEELDLVAMVLTDPDQAMAIRLLGGGGFGGWLGRRGGRVGDIGGLSTDRHACELNGAGGRVRRGWGGQL
jgi:hypothetical protein